MGKFKLKKSLLAGTSGHRKAVNLHKKNLALLQKVEDSRPDGRSKSSAFQSDASLENVKKKYSEATTDVTETDLGGGKTQVTETTKQDWQKDKDFVNKPDEGLPGSNICKEFERRKSQGGETFGATNCKEYQKAKADSLTDKGTDVDEKKWCQCVNQSTNQQIKYQGDEKCDPLPEPCKPIEEDKDDPCSCNTPDGKEIEYPCGQPEPEACKANKTPEKGTCACRDVNTKENVEMPCPTESHQRRADYNAKRGGGKPAMVGCGTHGDKKRDVKQRDALGCPEQCLYGSKITKTGCTEDITVTQQRALKKDCAKKNRNIFDGKRWEWSPRYCECMPKDIKLEVPDINVNLPNLNPLKPIARGIKSICSKNEPCAAYGGTSIKGGGFSF